MAPQSPEGEVCESCYHVRSFAVCQGTLYLRYCLRLKLRTLQCAEPVEVSVAEVSQMVLLVTNTPQPRSSRAFSSSLVDIAKCDAIKKYLDSILTRVN